MSARKIHQGLSQDPLALMRNSMRILLEALQKHPALSPKMTARVAEDTRLIEEVKDEAVLMRIRDYYPSISKASAIEETISTISEVRKQIENYPPQYCSDLSRNLEAASLRFETYLDLNYASALLAELKKVEEKIQADSAKNRKKTSKSAPKTVSVLDPQLLEELKQPLKGYIPLEEIKTIKINPSESTISFFAGNSAIAPKLSTTEQKIELMLAEYVDDAAAAIKIDEAMKTKVDKAMKARVDEFYINQLQALFRHLSAKQLQSFLKLRSFPVAKQKLNSNLMIAEQMLKDCLTGKVQTWQPYRPR